MTRQLSLLAFLYSRMVNRHSMLSRTQQRCLALEEREDPCVVFFKVLRDVMECFGDRYKVERDRSTWRSDTMIEVC